MSFTNSITVHKDCMEMLEETSVGNTCGPWVVIDATEWIDKGRYQHRKSIFALKENKEGGPFYRAVFVRSLGEYTFWSYQYETECIEVQSAEVTTKQWLPA